MVSKWAKLGRREQGENCLASFLESSEAMHCGHELKIWIALLASFLASGCGKEAAPEIIVWESEELTYAVVGQAKLCADAPERAQNVVEELSDWFGVRATGIRYKLYEDTATLRDFAPCSDHAGGCFSRGIVYTTTGADTHELVHAVADALGSPPRFLSEGAAVMFSEVFGIVDTQPIPEIVGNLDVLRLCTDDGWKEEADRDISSLYRNAGAFSRFLVETYGKERYLRLYEKLERGRSRDDVRKQFEDAFAISLEDLMERWSEWDFFSTETHYQLTQGVPTFGSGDEAVTLTYACGVSWGQDFEHDSNHRTILHWKGEPRRMITLKGMLSGSASGGLRLMLPETGELLVILDGPTDTFRVETQFYGPPVKLSIEQVALDAEVKIGATPAVVVSTSPEKHLPVCFPSPVNIGEVGTTVVEPGVFVTGLPLTMQCCADEECAEREMWPDGNPGSTTCPSGCIVPGLDFPTQWQSFPAAQAVGRRLVYSVQSE